MKNLGEKHKVLLIEDEPIALRVHELYLKRMGHSTDSAINGKQALGLYKRNYLAYKIIILDGGLPDIDGFEVAKYIRKHEKEKGLPRMPLIMLSGYPRDEVGHGSALADIDAFAIKPITYEHLKALMGRY